MLSYECFAYTKKFLILFKQQPEYCAINEWKSTFLDETTLFKEINFLPRC